MINLRETWNELLFRYTGKIRLINELWSEIEAAYTQSNRHYHNLAHLEYMVSKAREYHSSLAGPDIVLFSTFYHDIVYHTLRRDSEQKSAGIAQDRLVRIGLPAEKIRKCYNQIIATKSHKESVEKDTNFLLDFDLAVLGESPQQYREYSQKIREEFSVYPDFIYNRGRERVLRHFLDMERIFKTKEFYSKYELQAKKNLAEELERLK